MAPLVVASTFRRDGFALMYSESWWEFYFPLLDEHPRQIALKSPQRSPLFFVTGFYLAGSTVFIIINYLQTR